MVKLSTARIRKAKDYLKQFSQRDIWETVFENVHRSDFLRGRRNGPGHENFVADFDWLLSKGKNDQVENCVKVFEGKYS